MLTRRDVFRNSAAFAGLTILPFSAHAAAHAGDSFAGGAVTVFPVAHASFVMTTPAGVIYADPVGDAAAYDGLPPADLILVTHEHGDHFNVDTLTALKGESTALITNPAVFGKLPEGLKGNASEIGNGGSAAFGGAAIDAIPAYNMTPDRANFHPQGRDNGYVLTLDGFRVYISGDTEDIPEMRSLSGIDLCFLCMNLPFTMDAEAAASAVREFGPSYVYPYHYRGRDGGAQDPAHFAELAGDATEVKFAEWYG